MNDLTNFFSIALLPNVLVAEIRQKIANVAVRVDRGKLYHSLNDFRGRKFVCNTFWHSLSFV